MINRITYPDSNVKLKKLNQGKGMTYGELLQVLASMDEEHLAKKVIIYDEETNFLWQCYDFFQVVEDFQLESDTYESGQSFFVMPR